jgi:AcrR family transcriptional regulator
MNYKKTNIGRKSLIMKEKTKIKEKVKIKEDRILEASWTLLDKAGIEEFSMRKLANELNFQAPALYWYFPSKQSIFQALVNKISNEILSSIDLKGDWKEQLYSFSISIRDVLRKFPCSAQLLMKTLPNEPEYIRLINKLLQIIDTCSLSDNEKFSSITCLLNFIISFQLDIYEQTKVNIAMQSDTDKDAEKVFAESLSNLPDEDSDVLLRMHNNGIFQELGSDNMFKSGLRIIISGIEQLIHKDQNS